MRALALAIAVGAGCVQPAKTTTARPVASPEPTGMPAGPATSGTPYSLTISGGLSLGSYEAGMNWVLVEWLRRERDTDPSASAPTFAGVTGASAGAINALFSAVRYCEDGAPSSTVDANLFSDVWRPIGFETMLPLGEEAYAAPGDPIWDPDFLISRKHAFARAREALIEKLESRSYRPDCEVPVSLIVTKVVPGRVQIQSLSAQTQRYVVPLIAATVPTDGGVALEFRLNIDLAHTPDQRWVGNLVWLGPEEVRTGTEREPEERRFVISAEQVISAILASSAHPSSFGPVQLAHCVPRRSCAADALHAPADSPLCSQLADTLRFSDRDVVACTEPFTDGGAFDNIPLGVAVAQAEQHAWRSGFAPRYVFMDPGQRREEASALGRLGAYPGVCNGGDGEDDETWSGRDPVRELSTFVGGFLSAATNRELYTVLRYLEWNTTPAQLVADLAVLLEDVTGETDPALSKALDELAAAVSAHELRGDFERWDDARIALAEAASTALDELSECVPTGASQTAQSQAQEACVERYGPESATAIESMRRRIDAWATSSSSGRRLHIPSRFSPITGAMLGHFAAFVDQPFRDFDYHAGVYDGLSAVVEWECPGCDAGERRRRIAELWTELSPEQKPGDAADGVVRLLLDLEAAARGHESMPDFGTGPEQQILAALTRGGRCVAEPQACWQDCSFSGFVAALDHVGYEARTPLGAEILSRGDDWWTPLALRIADRLEMLEEDLAKPASGLTWSRRAGSLVAAHWYRNAEDGWAPPSVARRMPWRMFLPYLVLSGNDERKVDIGLIGGGVCLGMACLVSDVSLRAGALPAEPGEEPLGPFAEDRGHWSFDVHGGVRFRLPSWHLSSLQLRAGYSPDALAFGVDLPHDLSFELALGLVLDRLRVGIGCNAGSTEHGGCFDNPYLLVGFGDLTGWLSAIF